MPAPSVPVEAILPALTLVFCCAASVPLLVKVPDVDTTTSRCA
ncbi:hypothetical protein AWB82_07138 [Caballeronia glebae]|uniref:Uncharacterized protein n=1 Tax=Caballeronia glebae TaxID=1777143 RepID=A0A158DS59_9BURK|nr:hypothetical protein AWB82_07138 [Caballeronia glebae]